VETEDEKEKMNGEEKRYKREENEVSFCRKYIENNEEEIKWIRKIKRRKENRVARRKKVGIKMTDGRKIREIITRSLSYYMSSLKQYT
jgi:hypothetical protein